MSNTNDTASVPFARRALWPAVTGLTALVAIGAATVFWPADTARASNPPPAAAPAPAQVARVEARETRLWAEYSGRLEAVQRVDVRPRVAGAVQAVHFTEGALVKAGDLLVSLDRAPYAAELEQAEAHVAAAQTRASLARLEGERARRLWDDKAIAQREYDERASALRQAESAVRAAEAQAQIARLNLGYTQVRAPVAGRVGRIEVTVGNLVGAGPQAPVLTTLVSVSPIYASFDADEAAVADALRQLPDARDGRRAIGRVPVQMGTGASDGTPHAGRLQLIDNQVDARSGTVRVRAAFDNADGSLMPGQFARVRLGQAEAKRVLLVTERAIGTDQDKKFVLVVGEGGKLAYRTVQLGATVDGLRVVREGLKPGERIVVNGLQRLRPGAVVAPQEVAMDAPAVPGGTAAARPAPTTAS